MDILLNTPKFRIRIAVLIAASASENHHLRLIFHCSCKMSKLLHYLYPAVRICGGRNQFQSDDNDTDKILIKREPLVYTRARCAVQKNKQKKIFRLGQYKLKKTKQQNKKQKI